MCATKLFCATSGMKTVELFIAQKNAELRTDSKIADNPCLFLFRQQGIEVNVKRFFESNETEIGFRSCLRSAYKIKIAHIFSFRDN